MAWRTPHERRRLVPGAQEAERIGVPAPHMAGGSFAHHFQLCGADHTFLATRSFSAATPVLVL